MKTKNIILIFITLTLVVGTAYFASKTIAPLLILGVQIAGSGRFAILDKYTNKEFEPKNRATANSTINMLVEIFMIIAVQLGGYIQDVNSTKIIYSLLGVMTVFFVTPFAVQLVQEHRAYQKTKIEAGVLESTIKNG